MRVEDRRIGGGLLVSVAVLVCLGTWTQCHTPPLVAQPETLVPLLRSVSGIASYLAADAAERGDRVGCWTGGAVGESLSVAASVVEAGGAEIPALAIDVSECVALSPPGSASEASTAVSLVGSLAAPILALATTDAPCPTRVAVAAVGSYLSAIAPEVAAELEAADGMLSLPAVAIGSCE